MIKKILIWVVAVSALASAVGVALVAGAFALYALMVPLVGQPGAAAIVAAVAAVLVGLIALFFRIHAEGGSSHRRHPEPEPSLTERLVQAARERPLIAGAAALAAGMIALKNPQAAAGLVSAFLAGKASDKPDYSRRRR